MKRNNSIFTHNVKLAVWLDRILAVGIAIFLIGLPFHLVIKSLFVDPFGTYWKEILLGILGLIWVARCVIARQLLLTQTLLDRAILVFAGLIVIRYLVDGATQVAGWGLYISILYLPLVFLVPVVLRRYPGILSGLVAMLVALGGLIALGGVIEFIVNHPLWPSAELVTRQGFPDVFIYGTQLRRVYFVLDSPTTLANTLALLLPLAVVQVFTLRRMAWRVASGIAGALIFACILLTFSRGIWVAIVLAALAVVILQWFMAGNRKVLLTINRKVLMAVAGIVGVTLVIFVVLLFVRPTATEPTRYDLELANDAYQQVPIQGNGISLMSIPAQTGPVKFQTWTLYNAVAENNDIRKVLFNPPVAKEPGEVIYRTSIPTSGALRFSIAMDPKIWTPDRGDGVNFKIFLKDTGDPNSGTTVFLRYINPKINPSDRRWRNYMLDLSAWSGKTVDLSLITEAGPQSNPDYDWAGWADLQLESVPQTYFQTHMPIPENPLMGQVASITDWTQDETNQDRLFAWNTSISAWLKSPWWGNGLGTTGVAALRTMPQAAFVTESQLLKSMVELGIPGLLTWAFLWFSIGQFAFRDYKTTEAGGQRLLHLAIICSLLIVFIEGLVYQNLEVKQVNAIFWTLVGVLAFLGMVKPVQVSTELSK